MHCEVSAPFQPFLLSFSPLSLPFSGTKQSGKKLQDIVLSPWSKGDPHKFIRIHREVRYGIYDIEFLRDPPCRGEHAHIAHTTHTTQIHAQYRYTHNTHKQIHTHTHAHTHISVVSRVRLSMHQHPEVCIYILRKLCKICMAYYSHRS